MLWLLFSFLAPLAWGTGNVGDKYIFSKWLKHSQAALMAFGFFGLIAAIIVFSLKGFGHASAGLIVGALLSGALYMLANLFYYRAVQLGEVSRIIPIIYLEPLFTAAISAAILGEIFAPLKYLGIILMVAGAIIISYHKSSGFRFSPAVRLAFVGAILFSLNVVFTKYLLNRADFWTVYAFVRAGTFLSLIPVCLLQKAALKELISLKPVGLGLLALNNIFTLLGTLFFTIAASLGFITLTTSLSATQPFFVLMITLGLGLFYPKILQEEQGKGIFFQKLLAIVLMFVGVLLIT